MRRPCVQLHKPSTSLRRKTSALVLREVSRQRFAHLRRLVAAPEPHPEPLQESEAHVGLQEDTAPVLLWLSGLDAQRTSFQQLWLESTGQEAEHKQAYAWSDSIHPEDRQSCLNTYLAAFQARQGFRIEYRLRRADGGYQWVLDTGVPRFTPKGNFTGYLGSCIDITERKQLEETLNRQTLELQSLVAELHHLACVAAHDFQEPLRMVTSYVQLLARRYAGRLEPEAEQWIAYAVDGSKRLQRLILDLLAYYDVSTRSLELTTLESGVLVASALSDLQDTITDKGVTITTDPLPTVYGDSMLLQIVFRNLIHNGIKFRRQEPPHIHISAASTKNGWMFAVRDNGTGIDPQQGKRLFVVFQRLHAKEQYPKPGVGLAICKKIVERHGGRIWVESKVGRGATFFFTIPLMPQKRMRHGNFAGRR